MAVADNCSIRIPANGKFAPIEVKWLTKNKDYYLNLATVIIGGSGSGKTTLINEISYLLRDEIPNVIVVCSEASKKFYKGKAPERFTFSDLTKAQIQNLWDRQRNLTEVCRLANELDNLTNLANHIMTNEHRNAINSINGHVEKYIATIRSSPSISFADKQSSEAAARDIHKQRLAQLYKTIIAEHEDALKLKRLNAMELATLRFYNVNPRIMIILDDVSDKFNTWMKYFSKTTTNPFESIFYQGRHYNITFIFGVHDETIINPSLRKSIRTIIYGTSQAALAAFSRSSNGYSKLERTKVESIMPYIYADETSSIKTYKKLCFVREEQNPFFYTIASQYPAFRLGCAAQWIMNDAIATNNSDLQNNPFFNST